MATRQRLAAAAANAVRGRDGVIKPAAATPLVARRKDRRERTRDVFITEIMMFISLAVRAIITPAWPFGK
jgi:hypothetical protein